MIRSTLSAAAKAGDGSCRYEEEETMNRTSITIWICAAVFCVSLFIAVIPLANSESYFAYGISPKVIGTLLLGWGLIITVCSFLVKSKTKSKPRSF
jgi:hypothetical protein